jgi:DNA-binding SARP family transcriptional activator/tetratricopeptide (TPR) repeat protein
MSTDVAPLRVRLLGGFVIEGLDERTLGTRKARILLKRLAVAAGRPVSTDELSDAVWGDDRPSRPNDQLSVLVSRLRGVLGADRIPRTDAGYSLAADWTDVVELRSLATEVEARMRAGELGAAMAGAQSVLALANGSLLPEEDAEWVDAARPAIDRLVADARLLAAEAALAAGSPAEARAAAQGVLDHDPYDEVALRLVMRADVGAGRPGAALAAYAHVRHRLADDLGVDLSPETEDLHTAIVRGELVAIVASDSGLVGRVAELALLNDALRRAAAGTAAVLVIEGEAGIGKSALLRRWMLDAGTSALVVAGRCDELGRDLPLQPVFDGLAAQLAGLGREATAALLGPEAALLNPFLGRGVPTDPAPVTTVVDAAAGRAALFGALLAVLGRAAGERPLVLVVDDLHSAAAGTAEFLAFAPRRLSHVMVVASRRPQPGPDLPQAERLVVGPLSFDEAATLVGAQCADEVYARSGGHPLFLRELASQPSGDLPATIVDAVRVSLAELGDAAPSVQAAAVCGSDVAVDLVAAVMGQPVRVVLDHLERATRVRMLEPRGSGLGFSHELIREAVEKTATPTRRTAIHQEALAFMAAYGPDDPLAMARHARQAGDRSRAADALAAAASRAAERFEIETAELLLNEAIELADAAPIRLARGRLRLARIDLDGAAADAARAIELGGGVSGFELAGWVAYYRRDFETALRYADEGVERSHDDPAVRASCLALGGRIRHTRGDLGDAQQRLEEGVRVAPPAIRGVVQVWHAQLLAHQGDTGAAIDLARRALLDPHFGHPFAAGHGRFTLIYALAVAGRWEEALEAVEDLETQIARQGDRRFPPVVANMRGWLLRGVGRIEEATELHEAALEMAPGPTMLEAHYAALLDLTELHLARGDADAAREVSQSSQGVLEWTGSMFWRHRNRYRLLAARIASAGGNHDAAAEEARQVAAAAAARGDRRYAHRGLLVTAAADARRGVAPDLGSLGAVIERFVPISGPDGWRDLAELARATGSPVVWRRAEELASTLVRSAGGGSDIERAVGQQLERYRL